MTAPLSPTAPSARSPRPRWLKPVIAGAIVVVLLAGAVTAILVHRHLHRADDFIALVRLDSRVVFPEEAPEEHLRRMYDTQCEHIDEGWTRLDVLAASASQWEATGHLAKVTEQEFYTSQIAVFEAARATC